MFKFNRKDTRMIGSQFLDGGCSGGDLFQKTKKKKTTKI